MMLSMRVSFMLTLIMMIALTRQAASADLSVGAFNIQIFGTSKSGKPEVMDTLVKIVKEFDLMLVQEVRDISETTIPGFLELLNEAGGPFAVASSERLGRTSSKEQYAYYYRTDKLELTDTYQYNDSVNDDFEREPFAVRFRSTTTEIKDFGLIGIHTKPDDAVQETSKLAQVYDDVRVEWNLEDILVLGDFNADCSYITNSEWSEVELRTDDRFQWLIPDDADTTVSNTDCAYDRFAVAGANLQAAVVSDSATILLYDDTYSLTQEEALEVSDHYPIKLLLQGEPSDNGSTGDKLKSSKIMALVLAAFCVMFVQSS